MVERQVEEGEGNFQKEDRGRTNGNREARADRVILPEQDFGARRCEERHPEKSEKERN